MKIKQILLFFILFFAVKSVGFAFSFDEFSEFYYSNISLKYSVKLLNGDIISGDILEIFRVKKAISNDKNNKINDNFSQNLDEISVDKNKITVSESFLILKTEFGEFTIYEDEIFDILTQKVADFRQNHSLYLMPTANPISNNHFIGNYELFFIYGGFGLGDWLSISAGHSFLPLTNSHEQISIFNSKISFPKLTVSENADVSFAFGANFSWLNTNNKFMHLFGLATYNSGELSGANFTVGAFYKFGEQDIPATVRMFERYFNVDYPDGSFGICAGLEKKFSKRNDLSLLLEVWNSNVIEAANTAILLGLRISNEHFYSDFGLSVFTQPFAAPFFSFVWMPFN